MGGEEVQYLARSGRPSTALTNKNIDEIMKMVIEKRSLGVREVAPELETSHMSINNTFTDVSGMRQCTTWAVQCMTCSERDEIFAKERRRSVAEDIVSQASCNSNSTKRIISGAETRIYENDMQTSQQVLEYRFKTKPKPQKTLLSRSKVNF